MWRGLAWESKLLVCCYFELYLLTSGEIVRPLSWMVLAMFGIKKEDVVRTVADLRYIALSAVLGKCFCRAVMLLAERLQPPVPTARRMQALGYSRGMSTMYPIGTMHSAMRCAAVLGLDIVLCSLDIYRCFEYIRHMDIEAGVRETGLPR